MPAFLSSLLPVVRASGWYDKEHEEWIDQYKKSYGCDPDVLTPEDRLRLTWQSVLKHKDWEWDLIWMTAHSSFIFASVIGMQAKNTENRLAVIRQYSEVQFDHPFLAQRKMRDQQYLRNMRNGFKLGWRVSLFSTLLMSGALSSLSYRNYINPLDFAVMGAVLGGVWKWQRGPKGMLVAASIAGSMGLFGGCLSWALMKMAGVTVGEWRMGIGGQFFKDQAEVHKKVLRDFGNNEGLELLAEREVALQHRRYEAKMKNREAELAAKQIELANSAQKSK